jgi:integrase
MTFRLERLPGAPGAARGLEFLILTAARSNEVLGARWPEIDFERRLWIIPPKRMKAAREHRVPLPDRALVILKEMIAIRQSDFVFPGDKPKRPLSTMAFAMLLRRMRVDATTHGFRSSFKDWATERTASRTSFRKWRWRTRSKTGRRRPTGAGTCSKSAGS